MLNLFLTFLKINFLCTSGPASIGLTKELTVPSMVSEDKFNQIVAITSGIPGSDAMQMAWQVGYAVKGIAGSIVAVIAALIPTILLLGIVYFSMNFIDQKALAKFFSGVTPALALLLTCTAFGMIKPSMGVVQGIILAVSAIMVYLKVPVAIMLVTCGLIGVFLM